MENIISSHVNVYIKTSSILTEKAVISFIVVEITHFSTL